MIVLSNSASQTLTPGQSVTFDTVVLQTGNGECHRQNSSAVKLRCRGVYAVAFHANIGGTAAGAVQLNLEASGEILPETLMISTAGASGDLNNVGTETLVKNCGCDYDKITVTNTGTSDVVIGANSALVVERRS